MEYFHKDIPWSRCVVYLDNLLVHAKGFKDAISNLAGVFTAIRQAGLKWSEACSVAFQLLKKALSEAPFLVYPDPKQRFIVDTDASGVGIGAELSQGGETGEQVMAYYSCSRSRPEGNYCTVSSSRFIMRTDHASLTWLLNFKQPEGQVARWLEILQEYDYEILHRTGRQHDNAECLSYECCYCRHHEE
ncbi:hypothetical protein Q8A73_006519 [Channa argus]|nr:hypothetical protein Q8A73_006519 [Channa argus]